MVIYNKALKSQIARRLAAALLVTTGGIASLFAANKLTVQDFSITKDGTYIVSVKMENDPNVVTLAATVKLPAGFTIVKQYDDAVDKNVNFVLNTARTYDPALLYNEQSRERHRIGDNNNYGGNGYIMSVTHRDNLPFIGNSGDEIFQFEIQGDGTRTVGEKDSIVIDNISFSKKIEEEGKEPEIIRDNEHNRAVAKMDIVAEMPPTAVVYPAETQFSILPGYDNRHIMVIRMNNSSNVYSMEGRITLPEGMKIIEGVEGGYKYGINNSSRAKELNAKYNSKTGKFFLATDEVGDNKIIPGDGEIFAFIVEANNNLAADTKILLTEMYLTTKYEGHLYTVQPKDFFINVKNTAVASKAAEASSMVDSLREAVNALNIEDPVREQAANDDDLKALVDAADAAIAAAVAKVDAVDELVQARIADGNIATDASQAAVNAAKQEAVKAIKDAKDAIEAANDLYNKNYGANEEAYTRLNGQLDELQRRLNWANDRMLGSPVQPEFADESAEIQHDIDSLKAEVKDLYDQKKLTKLTSIDETVARIDQDITDMQTAFNQEVDKYNENKNAYANLKPVADALREKLEKAKADVAADTDVADEFEAALEAAEQKVDSLVDDLEAQYAARQLTLATKIGDKAIAAVLDKIVADADAAQQAENDAAELAGSLISSLEQRRDQADEDAASEGIEEKVAAEKAAADSLLEELEDYVTANKGDLTKEAVDTKVTKLINEASDAVYNYEHAVFEYGENIRKNKENQEALQGDLDSLKGDSKVDDAIEKLKEDCPYISKQLTDSLSGKKDSIDGAIDALKEEVDSLAGERMLSDEETLQKLNKKIDSLEQAIQDLLAAIKAKAQDYAIHHQKGDVNMDTNVDVADFQRVVYLVLHDAEKPVAGTEAFSQADVNGDKELDIADAQKVLNVMAAGSRDMEQADASADAVSARVVSVSGGVKRIALTLANNATYGSFQADLVLPEGMRLVGKSLTSRTKNHTLLYAEESGKVRLVVASSAGNAIKGQGGDVVYVDVEGDGEVSFDNVIFADMRGGAHKFAVSAGETTGISSAAVAGNSQESTVYSIGGRVMNALKKGVNIIRRADGSTQKVIR